MKTASGGALDYSIIENHPKYKSWLKKMNLLMDYLGKSFLGS